MGALNSSWAFSSGQHSETGLKLHFRGSRGKGRRWRDREETVNLEEGGGRIIISDLAKAEWRAFEWRNHTNKIEKKEFAHRSSDVSQLPGAVLIAGTTEGGVSWNGGQLCKRCRYARRCGQTCCLSPIGGDNHVTLVG